MVGREVVITRSLPSEIHRVNRVVSIPWCVVRSLIQTVVSKTQTTDVSAIGIDIIRRYLSTLYLRRTGAVCRVDGRAVDRGTVDSTPADGRASDSALEVRIALTDDVSVLVNAERRHAAVVPHGEVVRRGDDLGS